MTFEELKNTYPILWEKILYNTKKGASNRLQQQFNGDVQKYIEYLISGSIKTKEVFGNVSCLFIYSYTPEYIEDHKFWTYVNMESFNTAKQIIPHYFDSSGIIIKRNGLFNRFKQVGKNKKI